MDINLVKIIREGLFTPADQEDLNSRDEEFLQSLTPKDLREILIHVRQVALASDFDQLRYILVTGKLGNYTPLEGVFDDDLLPLLKGEYAEDLPSLKMTKVEASFSRWLRMMATQSGLDIDD
jgi:hypothetical protein